MYGINEKNNIPNLINTSDANCSPQILKELYEYRKKRAKLHTDDKILLSWNAWTIIAFTRCGYPESAVEIRDFIENNMTDIDNRLFLRYREGDAANDGQLDDYAVYSLALLDLYRTTFDIEFLEQAIFRAEQMLDFFEDENGVFFLTAHDAERLISRPKESYDGAIPSGNSVAAMVLESLAQLTGESRWRKAADRQMRFVAGQAEEYPAGHTFSMLARKKLCTHAANLSSAVKEYQKNLTAYARLI